MSDSLTAAPPSAHAFVHDVAQLVVGALYLDAEINPVAPLYGDELGLDSIGILEIALVGARHYGAQRRADNADNLPIFSSLRHLAKHVTALRNA